MRLRPTIRLRLTAWYATALLAGGALLLGGAYLIVRENVATETAEVRSRLELELGRPVAAPGTRVRPVPPELEREMRRAQPGPAPAEEITAAQGAVNRAALDRIVAAFGVALALAAAASLAAGWWAAGRALRPIAAIAATARRVSEERLHERLAFDGRATSFASSPTPSTRCSPAWRVRSRVSGASWRTHRTSCARPSPLCARHSTSL